MKTLLVIAVLAVLTFPVFAEERKEENFTKVPKELIMGQSENNDFKKYQGNSRVTGSGKKGMEIEFSFDTSFPDKNNEGDCFYKSGNFYYSGKLVDIFRDGNYVLILAKVSESRYKIYLLNLFSDYIRCIFRMSNPFVRNYGKPKALSMFRGVIVLSCLKDFERGSTVYVDSNFGQIISAKNYEYSD